MPLLDLVVAVDHDARAVGALAGVSVGPGGGADYVRSRANRIAASTSCIFSAESTAIRCRINVFGIVAISSRLATHREGRPSLVSSGTSTGMFLMVLVTGATVTADRTW
jgi:hypothetical protein